MKYNFIFLTYGSLMLATPRIALENGTLCSACHINPTGGALRNSHGIEIVSLDELPASDNSRFYPDNYSGILNDFLRVGGDFRVQAFSYEENLRRENRLIPMQAEIYGWLFLSRQLGFYVEADLSPGGYGQEYWALFQSGDRNGWLKVGKALPNYGLRLDNHSAFIRGGAVRQSYGIITNFLPFSPTARKPVLVEGGFTVKHNIRFTVSAGESLAPAVEPGFTTFTGMIQLYGHNPFSRHQISLQYMQQNDQHLVGLSGGIGNPHFTLLAEINRVTANNHIQSLVLYEEFTWTVIQGFHVTGTYEFVDPDQALKTGSLSRFTTGIDYFPVPLVEILFQVRAYRANTILNDIGNAPEYIIQLHTWF
ncbi:MAG: hypothetical protein ACE5D8_08340 [Fidelibacterota bacterium]